ncbi:L-glyceraldehyde 3-phosphate reductase, partial [Streptomyces sp. SID11233]|nr:L-glyceraldehyde 3-phosphate reductase [Streptomyces sp. SID11233]
RDSLLDTLETAGMGCISFVPLAQGVLTGKYLGGIPEGSRATQGKSLDPTTLTEGRIKKLNELNEIASG